MEKNRKLCIVCKTENSIYKCPKCQEHYCSIKCYKEHKIKFIEKKEEKKEKEPLIKNDLNLKEDEDIILSKEELKKLRKNKAILDKIKNKQLQKIIKEIDGAKYKKKLLKKFMDSDEEFKEFTCEIVRTLGFTKSNEFVIEK